MRRLLRGSLLVLIIALITAVPVLAATYFANIQIQETNSIAYTQLPLVYSIDNQYLADNDYMDADALDTRVIAGSATAQPHLVASDTLLFVTDIGADSTTNLKYTLGNTPLTNFPVIAGYNGRVETADAAALELGQDFEIEFDGYVDTTEASVPLIYKQDAFLIEVSAVGTITAGTINVDSYDVTPAFGGAGWHDCDVSNYVPDGASGIVVEIDTLNNLLETGLRKNGSTDDRHSDTMHYWGMIGVDDSRIFEVYLENNTIDVYIRGYTDSNWVYKTNADDISLGGMLAWTDIDVSTEAPDAIGAIIEVVNTNIPAETGVRKNGSTDNRHVDLDGPGHTWRVVGLDDSQIFEGYIEAVDVDFYLIGYVTGGATFATNGTDKSLGVSGAWTDVDCSTEAPDATYLLFETLTPGFNVGAGYRENSCTDNIISMITEEQVQGIAKCDMNQVCEGYEVNHLQSESWLIGYSEYGVYPPFPNPTYLVSVSVGAGAIPSDEYNVVVTGTGGAGNLEVDVGSGTYTGNNPIGAGVTDTTNNWRFMSPAVPFIDDYYHTVNSVLQITYEPDNMLTDNVVEDETNAFDGYIAWGSNPASVTVTIGSLTSYTQPAISGAAPTEPSQDVVGETSQPGWTATTETLTTHPFYPAVKIASDLTDFTVPQLWIGLATLIVIAAMLAIFKFVPHQLITIVVGGALSGYFVAMGIYPFWIIFVFALAGVAILLWERTPSV